MMIDELLKQVCIPPEHLHIGDALSRDTAQLPPLLERWRTEVVVSLRDLASHLAISGRPSAEKQGLLVVHIAQYIGTDPWISGDARSQAEGGCPPYPWGEAHVPKLADILENYVSQDLSLITHVLSDQVRPLFQSHVHPRVNPSTGRVLNRIAGGPLASQDLYSSQSWKESHPGISNVLLWVVARIKVKAFHVPRCACI